ncbi:MAG: APC family permease [Lachnospiraceae bacterium]|nr:APC family permease [Lachnospiraceae bacterium]
MSEKKWSLKTIVLYGINCVIGSGIFLLPGAAYKLLGPGSLLAYLFVFVLVMSVALCFAECGSMFEESGGPYLYARKAFGDFFGYEVGVMKWIVSIIAWATMAVAFATALSALVPQLSDPTMQKMVAIGIIVVLSAVNLFGVNVMAYLNNISTIGKLVPMAVFVIGGLFFIKLENFTPFIAEGATSASVSAAIITVFYAFTGFKNVGVAAGDMENPTKNVPKALILSMSIVSIIYFLIQFHCIGTLGSALGDTSTPVADAMGTFLGSKGALLVTLGTLVSVGGLNIAGSFNTPRCAQALAEGALLPESFKKCNKYNVPYISVIITGVLALLLTLTGSFSELAAISVISRFSQYIPTCIAVPVLRKKHPEMKAGYQVPLGYLFPVIAVAASCWLLINTESYKLIAGLGAMVVVAPLYFVMKRRGEKKSI